MIKLRICRYEWHRQTQKILLYNWDAHGSHACDIHERKKNIIMCMHDDSKCLIC
jgi:hypothetical protein